MGSPSPSQRDAHRIAKRVRERFNSAGYYPKVITGPVPSGGVEVWQAYIAPRYAIDNGLYGDWRISGYWRFGQDIGSHDAFLRESSVGLNVEPMPPPLKTAAQNPATVPAAADQASCLVRYDYSASDERPFHLNLRQFEPLQDSVHWRIPWSIETDEDEICLAPIDWLLSNDLKSDLARYWPQS